MTPRPTSSVPLKPACSKRWSTKRLASIGFGVVALVWLSSAQQLSREYIRMGGRVVAIEHPAAQAVQVTATKDTLAVGETATLSATGGPQGATYTWSVAAADGSTAPAGQISVQGLYRASITGLTADRAVKVTATVSASLSGNKIVTVKPVFTPASAVASVPAEGGTVVVPVFKTTAWTAAPDQNCQPTPCTPPLTVTYTTTQVTATIAANAGSSARSLSFTVSDGDPLSAAVFRVDQAGAASTALVYVTPAAAEYGPGGATNRSFGVTVSGGASWSVSSPVPSGWIEIVSPAVGANQTTSGSVVFNVLPNPVNANRTATITINGPGPASNRTFTVTQTGERPTFSPTSLSFAAVPEGRKSFQVIFQSATPWRIDNTPPSWMFITYPPETTFVGSGLLYVEVTTNTGPARTGQIIINGTTFNVTQAGVPQGLRVDPTSIIVSLSGFTYQFRAYLNGNTVPATDITWTISPSDGSAGTINTTTGVYMSPQSIASTSTATITATDSASRQATSTLYLFPTSGLPTPDVQPRAANFGRWNEFIRLPFYSPLQAFMPAEVLITANGGAPFPSATNSCHLRIFPASAYLDPTTGISYPWFTLTNDDPSTGTSAMVYGPAGTPLENSQCIVNPAAITQQSLSSAHQIYQGIAFKSGFGGPKSVWIKWTSGITTGFNPPPSFDGGKYADWVLYGPLPPAVEITSPASGASVSGDVSIAGWALDHPDSPQTAINKVEVYVDGNKVGNATYGSAAPSGVESCTGRPLFPNCPNIGFTFSFDSRTVPNGNHTVRVVATDSDLVAGGTTPAPNVGSFERIVNVNNPVSVTLTPATATLNVREAVTLVAQVSNATNTNVTWSLSPNVGDLVGNIYTAPPAIVTQQTVTVTATSLQDPSKSASATITLRPVSLSVSPATASLSVLQTQVITPTLTGANNQQLTWTLTPSVGSITAATTGNATNTYTAPGTITAQQVIRAEATSTADPSKKAAIDITLTPVSISPSPAAVSLTAGQTQQFTATVTGSSNTAVTWSRDPAVGTISATGLYTAPATITGRQTVTITATSNADATKTATMTVTLGNFIVTPSSVSLPATGTQQLTATFGGVATAASWNLNPNVGAITAGGLYSAPSLVPSVQTVTITATHTAAPSMTATATITLLPITVSVSPQAITLNVNQTATFVATVGNTANPAVNWEISPLTGSISATGVYSAPATIATRQAVTVTAKSQADLTKLATATITLDPITAFLTPSALTLGPGAVQQFTPKLTGATNPGVSYTLSPTMGSISGGGLYSAPGAISSQQNVTLTATSLVDGSKSASSNITLACISTAAPANRRFTSAGGSSAVTITAPGTCSWTAATDSATWLTLQTPAGTGNGSFSYLPGANTGSARLATVSGVGTAFRVMQDGESSAVPFNDVAASHPHFDYISLMKNLGFTAGCSVSPPLYCPDNTLTRAQMAVFIIAALNRALGTPNTYTPMAHFNDVTSASGFFPFVQRMRDLDITAGCSANPPLYCPDSSITHGQMAVFIIIAWMKVNNLSTFTYSTTPYFTDVPSTHPQFRFIQKMRDMGFWNGCNATQYCDTASVTRAQMAPMLLKAILGAP